MAHCVFFVTLCDLHFFYHRGHEEGTKDTEGLGWNNLGMIDRLNFRTIEFNERAKVIIS